MKRINPSRELIVMTNDPSITGWGYAVLDNQANILDCGCIKTEKETKKRRIRAGDDLIRRIALINDVLLSVMAKNKVNHLLSELPHGSQSAAAAKMIGAVAAIGQTIAMTTNTSIEWYSEGDAKKAILGRVSATKEAIIQRIDELYDVPWTGTKYIDEAIADSLAIYHAASQQSEILKFWKQ